MEIDDILTLEADSIGPLREPVMLVALSGWFDVANAATTALDRLAPPETSVTIGEIDPDPFYDFTQERPTVEIVDGEVRVVHWPENSFDLVRGVGERDLVVLIGTEPHVYWRTYASCITQVAHRLGCEAVVSLGAAAEAVPHTRAPWVTGSTTTPALAERLGLAAPSYQGMTGVAGVLLAELDAAAMPSISLRVGIPHYLMNAEHPQAVAALQTHLAHVLGIPIHEDFADEIDRWRSLHDELVANDVQLQLYVRMLEEEHERRSEAAIPSADDLGAQFEAFLREQRDDD